MGTLGDTPLARTQTGAALFAAGTQNCTAASTSLGARVVFVILSVPRAGQAAPEEPRNFQQVELVLSRERGLHSQRGLSTCQVCLQLSPAWSVPWGLGSARSQGVS